MKKVIIGAALVGLGIYFLSKTAGAQPPIGTLDITCPPIIYAPLGTSASIPVTVTAYGGNVISKELRLTTIAFSDSKFVSLNDGETDTVIFNVTNVIADTQYKVEVV